MLPIAMNVVWRLPPCCVGHACKGILVGVAITCGTMACGESSRAGAALERVALREVMSLRLKTTDTLPIGRARALLRDQAGGFLVSDLFYNRVIRFTDDGAAVQVYGRPGEGPGEFRQAAELVSVTDSSFAVSDLSRYVLNEFARDGRFLREVRYRGVLFSPVNQGGRIWFGMMHIAESTIVAVWEPHGTRFRYFVRMPQEYADSYILTGMRPGVSIAVWQDTIAVGVQGLNDIRIHDAQRGRLLETVELPVRERRGVPANLVAAMMPRRGRSYEDMFANSSVLMALFRTSDGSLLAIHGDYELHGRLITGTTYLTVLSPDRTRACVDAKLPTEPDEPQPRYAMSGDTLFILRQRLLEQDVRFDVSGYLVVSEGCDWMAATRRFEAPPS